MPPGAALFINAGGTNEWTGGNLGTLFTSGAFATGSVVGIDTTDAVSAVTNAGSIGGGVGLTKLGVGILALTGSNSYSGGTNVNAGTLQVQTANALPGGTMSGYNVASGAMVSFNVGGSGEFTGSSAGTTLATAGTWTSGAGLGFDTSDASAPVTYSSNIGGNVGAVTKFGPGTLALTGTGGYTGPTTIAGGMLSFAAGALSLGNTANNQILFSGSSGTLQWAGANTTDVSANLTALTAGQTVTLDTNGNNVAFASTSAFTGGATGTLVKAGQGTLTMPTNTTYISFNYPVFLVNTAADNANYYQVQGGAMAANLEVTAGTLQFTQPGGKNFLWVGPWANESSGTIGVSGGLLSAQVLVMGYGVYNNTAACNSVLERRRRDRTDHPDKLRLRLGHLWRRAQPNQHGEPECGPSLPRRQQQRRPV